MKSAGPKVAVRQGGGTRQGFGHFNEEHLEQEASASATQQKQLTQQAVSSSQSGAAPAAQPAANTPQAPPPPREVGTFKDEAKRFVSDILVGIKAFFNLNDIVGIHPGDTPEEQQRKQAAHQGYEKLTEEQQAVARKLYEEKMAKLKAEEDQKEQQKQAAAAQPAAITPPTSPQKGPVGPAGSRKQRAVAKLQHDRQTLSSAQGAG